MLGIGGNSGGIPTNVNGVSYVSILGPEGGDLFNVRNVTIRWPGKIRVVQIRRQVFHEHQM